MNKVKAGKKELSAKRREELLATLEARFQKNMNRRKAVVWSEVKARLESQPGKLWSLDRLEETGGEPDVVGQDTSTGEYIYFDCSPETPKGRVSVCYDREGWESRREHWPATNAIDMAVTMGIDLLTEDQYLELQQMGEFSACRHRISVCCSRQLCAEPRCGARGQF